MDYKKLYKEALERARAINEGKTTGAFGETVCEYIFPELKESEDEKIRKELMNIINLSYDCGIAITKENRDRYIAWLEKQAPKLKWKQEDDENLRDIISAIHYIPYQTTEAEVERTDWLQSLKQRMEEQQ